MKLERLGEYVTITVVTLGGILFALYAGKLSGNFQFGSLVMIFGAMTAVVLTLVLRTNIWMLIPITWPLLGQVRVLPLPFSANELAILLVFPAFLVFKALKISRRKPVWGYLEIVLWINVLYLVSVFVRNPVGTEVIGSSKVGGKPYATIAIAAMGCWVLARVTIAAHLANRLPLFMTLGAMSEGFIGYITNRFPSTAGPISAIYTGGVSMDTYNAQTSTEPMGAAPVMARAGYMVSLGAPLMRLLCSWFSPFTLLLPVYFWRFCLTVFASYALLAAGYRSAVLAAMMMFALCTYFRRRTNDLVRLAFVGVPLLVVLIILQGNFLQLPLEMQRSLSFIPAKWDADAVADAQGTTEWRVNIWKTVLLTDKYIDNKILGDGFGYTRAQYQQMILNGNYGLVGENQMISGDYHSGPVSTIRFVGVVGLALFYVLLIALAREAWRIVRLTTDTPFFMLALFVCCPIIYEPINFTFIFGAFQTALPTALFSAGMLRMLSNSLEVWRAPAPAKIEEPRPGTQRRARRLEPVGAAFSVRPRTAS